VSALSFNERQIYFPKLHNCFTFVMLNNCNKMRLSSHNLAVEQGRYYNVNRNNRNCKFCIDDMEDEMHFILLCPMYTNLRKTKHIQNITHTNIYIYIISPHRTLQIHYRL
jgi:hypothetical protein